MRALNKAKLVESIVDELQLEKTDAKALVERFFDVIRQKLFTGEYVKLSGFGNFILRDKKLRPGRNPKTGESIPVSARRVLKEKVHAFTKRNA